MTIQEEMKTLSATMKARFRRIRVDDLHKQWMKDPNYRREYEALEEEFSLKAALIEARTRAGLTQEEVAQRMKTTQAVIARLEGGGSQPSTSTLVRYARATGTRLRISFEPMSAGRRRAS
jgi:ribosome-binding protein aMBF1 (putative translation factor)